MRAAFGFLLLLLAAAPEAFADPTPEEIIQRFAAKEAEASVGPRTKPLQQRDLSRPVPSKGSVRRLTWDEGSEPPWLVSSAQPWREPALAFQVLETLSALEEILRQ